MGKEGTRKEQLVVKRLLCLGQFLFTERIFMNQKHGFARILSTVPIDPRVAEAAGRL